MSTATVLEPELTTEPALRVECGMGIPPLDLSRPRGPAPATLAPPTTSDQVLGFAFSPLGSLVLLIRKNRPEWQAGKLNGIGGKIEPGELADEAMVREFREETGIESESSHWTKFLRYSANDHGTIIHCYATKTLVIERARSLTDEEVLRLTFREAAFGNHVPSLVPSLAWLLPMARFSIFEAGLEGFVNSWPR